MFANKQTDDFLRETNKETNKETNNETNNETNKQTKQTNKQTNKQITNRFEIEGKQLFGRNLTKQNVLFVTKISQEIENFKLINYAMENNGQIYIL
jgi:hypothetical protein